MIAPVTFAGVPRELVKPVNDTVGLLPPEGAPYNVDQWDGYTDDRREVFETLRDHGVTDTVFVTGDIHSGWACDLPADKATYAGTRNSVAVEFVASSVTSNNLKDITGTPRRTTSLAVEEGLKANNPHIKYLNFDDHGFSVLDITAKRAQMDWYVIGDRADRSTGVTWATSFATTAGSQVVHEVDGPVGS
jgi:alkaline phosphatase D